MMLAIDAGNTSITFGLFDRDAQKLGEWRCDTNGHRTANEYYFWLKERLDKAGLVIAEINRVSIGSVVPAITPRLVECAEQRLKCPVLNVGYPDTDFGFDILVDYPEEAGADRLLNAAAAKELYSVPAIVADFGTATTFDVIDSKGNYCGGAIAPGIDVSIEGLARRAAKLPEIELSVPSRVIGRNTVDAMLSGVFWGQISMVEGMFAKIEHEYGAKMTKIGTGGFSGYLAQGGDIFDHVDRDLTLHGLRILYERNMNDEKND